MPLISSYLISRSSCQKKSLQQLGLVVVDSPSKCTPKFRAALISFVEWPYLDPSNAIESIFFVDSSRSYSFASYEGYRMHSFLIVRINHNVRHLGLLMSSSSRCWKHLFRAAKHLHSSKLRIFWIDDRQDTDHVWKIKDLGRVSLRWVWTPRKNHHAPVKSLALSISGKLSPRSSTE